VSHSDARAPQQDRSRETLERILVASEELLERLPFDEIGVAQIVRRARCSTGSFYARFKGKDALLPLLYERYNAGLRPRMLARAAAVDPERLTLREAAELVAGTTVDMYAERRNLMRAVALYARAHPEAISPDVREARGETTDLPARLLARFADEIRHPDPLAAARVGFFIVAAVAREKMLFGAAPHASDTPLSDDQLKRELARVLYAYLTCP
jgi:AcrR family transcriptional regulator